MVHDNLDLLMTPQGTQTDSPQRLTIRQAQKEDLPGLEWKGEYIHYRQLFAQAYQEAENGHAVLWICELPSCGIIGQAFVQLLSQNRDLADGTVRAYVHGVRIMPDYRNQGIGTLLMNTLEQDLLRRGFGEIVLNVSRDNSGAIRLYIRLGFRIIGADAGEWSYIDHTGKRCFVKEPAWRMKKTIG
jgi:ribosomal protein S18 acetylase RimI-like enzyme